MARRKANEPRTTMKVPISFRDRVRREARALGISTVDYLEHKGVTTK